MASTFSPLGIELQATGENAGTWGTKTNTNLQIIEQISGGYIAKSIAGGAQTTALAVANTIASPLSVAEKVNESPEPDAYLNCTVCDPEVEFLKK